MMKFKLPKAVKAKWVAALRSGKYKQGKGCLCDKYYPGVVEGYCCLGVAVEAGLTKPSASPDKSDLFVSTKFLPMSIQKTLAEMNDGGHKVSPLWTFRRIAGWIEENL